MNKIILFFVIICSSYIGYSQSTQTMSDNYVPIPQVTSKISKPNAKAPKPPKEVKGTPNRSCKMEVDNCPAITYPDTVYLDGAEAEAALVGQLQIPEMPPNPDNCKIKTKYNNEGLGNPGLSFEFIKDNKPVTKSDNINVSGVLTYGSLRNFINSAGSLTDFTQCTLEIRQKIAGKCGEFQKKIIVIRKR